jgi:hypothetical protein
VVKMLRTLRVLTPYPRSGGALGGMTLRRE